MSPDGPTKVLVIDDDVACLRNARTVVEGLGHRFEGVLHAQLALEQLQKDPLPDCILIDLYMPGMDAVKFRELQIADPRLARVATVITTETRFSSVLASSGGVSLIQKPLDADRLRQAMAHAQNIVSKKSPLPRLTSMLRSR